jgi:hypothetical protein
LVNPVIFTEIYHIKIDSPILITSIRIIFQKKCFSHLATANAKPLIGRKNGAMSIAPITTATEFCNNHRAAIALDKNTSIQYSLSDWASFFTFSATACLSSQVSSKKSILSKIRFTLSESVSDFLLIISSTLICSVII